MTIYLAGNLIFDISFTGFGHLQLVRDGEEIEVQAPQPWFILGNWDFPGGKPHTVPDGTAIGDPNTYSSTALSLGTGISEDGAWSIFIQANANISQYILPYDVYFNSNSFANTLLNLVGHSTAEFISYPTSVSSYPGSDANAAEMPFGIHWNIVGSAGGDRLKGGWDNDVFQGGGGIDFLNGGAGDDTLYANSSGSYNDGVADYLTGGTGVDKFYVGTEYGSSSIAVYSSAVHDYVFNSASRGTYDILEDASELDSIYLTVSGESSWLELNEQDVSSYSISPTEYFLSGKTIYSVSISGYAYTLSGVYDTYYDANLGKDISVFVIYESENHTPLFGIETNEADSRDSQSRTNLNRWGKLEVCNGFGDIVAIRL